MHESYWMPEDPDKEYMAALNGPRTLAVAVSVAYVIRSIVDFGETLPEKDIPLVIVNLKIV